MIHSIDLPIKKRNILRAYLENNVNSINKDINLSSTQNGRLTPPNYSVDYVAKKRLLEEIKPKKKSDFFSRQKKLKVKSDATKEKPKWQGSESDAVKERQKCLGSKSEGAAVKEKPKCQGSESDVVKENPKWKSSESEVIKEKPKCQGSESKSDAVKEKPKCQGSESAKKTEEKLGSELYIEAEFLVRNKPDVEVICLEDEASETKKPTEKLTKLTKKRKMDDDIAIIETQLKKSRAFFRSLTQHPCSNIDSQMPPCPNVPFEVCANNCEFCEELKEVLESTEPEPLNKPPAPTLSLFEAHRLLMQKRERLTQFQELRPPSTLSCNEASSCLGDDAHDCCLLEEPSCPYSSPRILPYLGSTPPTPDSERLSQRSTKPCNGTTAKNTDTFQTMNRLIEESTMINIPPDIPELIPITSEDLNDPTEYNPVNEDITRQENKKNSKDKKPKTRQPPIVRQSEYKEIKYVKKTPTIETDHTYYRSNGVLEIWIDRRKMSDVLP